MLAAHNALRARLRLPPLTWSDRLAAAAQDWATTLIVNNQFRHRPHSRLGENLYEIRGGEAGPLQAFDAWAAEAKAYDYRRNRCHGVCGHYTQIVWRDTRQVGCAMAQSSTREVWVCEYNPPGNYIGERPY